MFIINGSLGLNRDKEKEGRKKGGRRKGRRTTEAKHLSHSGIKRSAVMTMPLRKCS